MASKTLSQSAHSAIMHWFTVPVCFHHCASAAAKMSLLYANALKILPIFFNAPRLERTPQSAPLIPIIIYLRRLLTCGASIYSLEHNSTTEAAF